MQQERILIVDDSAFMRTVIRTRLQKAGYQTLEAPDGASALELVRHEKDIALITMDVEMPHLDGFSTCRRLRNDETLPAYLKTLPVVFITSYDSVEDRFRGFEIGATDFVGKENLETELVSSVDRILHPGAEMIGLEALVVDDSFFARKIVARILSSCGMVVTEAENGQAALEIISRAPDRFDLLIVDLNMPVMNGMELTMRLRLELGLHQLPILMLSVTEDKVTQIEMFKAGISDYLTKPFIKEELIGRLRAHIEVALFNKKLREYLQELKQNKETIETISNERAELLHVLCHDLANPIGAVISALDAVGRHPERFVLFKDDLRKSAEQGLAVIRMVRELRAIEDNKREFELRAVNLKDAMEESLRILHRRFEDKNIVPIVNIPDDLMVRAEKISLVNCVCSNLLTNAVKFSYPDNRIDINAVREGSQVKMVVRDYGAGIPESLMPHLFSLNKATSRPGTCGETGTGFGMMLVRKFMGRYDGRIGVETRDEKAYPDDHGTTVNLYFRLATP
ncbi:MAG: response regulator [Victivallales bacterium]|nr:response regulator [Victivallales bacterium]